MKQVFYFLFFCFSISCAYSQQHKQLMVAASTSLITERLGVNGPLQFNKTDFHLAWSDKPNATYYVQEYLPKGENVDRFNQLLTINLFNKFVKTEDAINQKVYELNERKKTDPNCNYAINKSKDGKEFMIDFLLGEGSGNQAVVEFNIYHYKQIEIDNKPALIVYAYSKRSYGNDITAFLKNLKTERSTLLQTMSSTQIPQIKLSSK